MLAASGEEHALRARHAGHFLALRLAGASGWYWFVLGHLAEGRRRAERALVLTHLGGYALWRALGDDCGTALALFRLAHLAHDAGDTAQAEALYQASLALPRGEGAARGFVRGLALVLLARLWLEAGARVRARPLIEDALREAQHTGDRAVLGSALWDLGWSAYLVGEDERASAYLEQALALNRAIRSHVSILDALWALGLLELRRGDIARAAALLREALVHSAEQGNRRRLADYLAGLGLVAGETDDGRAGATRATRLFGAAARLREANTLSASPLRVVGERAVVAMRDRLGEAAFAAAWVAGQAEPLEAIIAEALAVGGGHPDAA